jgi:hypothetical protein
MTDEVMFEIGELTGQRYVNTYAGTAAEADLSAAPARVASVNDPVDDRPLAAAVS